MALARVAGGGRRARRPARGPRARGGPRRGHAAVNRPAQTGLAVTLTHGPSIEASIVSVVFYALLARSRTAREVNNLLYGSHTTAIRLYTWLG
jgi:hypothetical protein